MSTRTKYETNVVSKFLPLYTFSKVVPMPMQSCYSVTNSKGVYEPECATWWQWRGRVWNHRIFNERSGW